MPTMRQLVTSNQGQAWMRQPSNAQQVNVARNAFVTNASQLGYGGSMSSQLGNQVANALRAASLGMNNAASYLPQNMGSYGNGGMADVNELRNQQSALRAQMELTPGLNQGLPEYAAQRNQLMAQRDALQQQINAATQAQSASKQSQINNRVALQKQAADKANQWYASQGRYQQSTPQSMIGRADQAAAARYMPEGGGQAAQWGWDGGTGTWQPGNASARAATFGALRAPSPAYVASRQAEQQAYQIPAQQAARTQQLIYGYGGW